MKLCRDDALGRCATGNSKVNLPWPNRLAVSRRATESRRRRERAPRGVRARCAGHLTSRTGVLDGTVGCLLRFEATRREKTPRTRATDRERVWIHLATGSATAGFARALATRVHPSRPADDVAAAAAAPRPSAGPREPTRRDPASRPRGSARADATHTRSSEGRRTVCRERASSASAIRSARAGQVNHQDG